MLNEATKRNLRRKSAYVDRVQMHDGKPLPSWIDLSLTELCNRSAGSARPCVFCPRIDPAFYPNPKLHMAVDLVDRIADQLRAVNYQGVVVLCGYGEPMLHPELPRIVAGLHGLRVELVTNGDRLTAQKIAELKAAGLAYFVVSMYDGEHQRARFEAMFAEAGTADYLLRDRWHTAADDFGLKLTNRGGVVTVGDQDEIQTGRPCHYLTYQMQIDWNGDVLLCPQDWHKKVKFGNVAAQSFLEVWHSTAMQKRRLALIDGKRSDAPCASCNTDGTLHGFAHADEWLASMGSGRARKIA